MRSVGAEVTDFLQAKPTDTWTALLALLRLTQTLGRVGPVPARWVESLGTEAAEVIFGKAWKAAQDLDERELRLFSEFEPGVVDVVEHDMLVRYRTDHHSHLRRLISSGYRSDRKAIPAFRRGHGRMSFPQELNVVEEIVELKRLRAAWADAEAELAPALGSRIAGRDTNWDAVLRDIRDVQGLLECWAGNKTHLATLLTEEHNVHRSRELSEMLEQVTAEVEGLMDSHLAPGLVQQFQEDKIMVPFLEELIRDTTPTTDRVELAANTPVANARQPIPDLQALIELVRSGARLQALEQEHSQAHDALKVDFGARFNGFDTDWPDMLACLSWSDELRVKVPPGDLTSALLTHAEQPQAPSVYDEIADSAAKVLRRFRGHTEPLMEGYDLNGGPWDSWEQAKFDRINQWSGELSREADSASDWLLYRAAVSELDRIIGPFATERIRHESDDSGLVPRMVERRVLSAWLDSVYQQEPLLADFAASEQGNLIIKFRELDEQLPVAAQNEVRKRVYERYPDLYATSVKTSELGILRGELSKRRLQWPVRRLCRTIPRLIQTLKPCFLVSPLAVSQFLPLSEVASDTLSFDVVIFDEASQIYPEDAVPAILRGRQSILAGDQKQLPPTNFWRHSMADDRDDDADDAPSGELTGRDSVLDVAVGLVGRLFNEAHLNVHYQSRDESLIRFSNHYFYNDLLLTFPSPGIKDSWLGVHDVYVPDGRWDAGATRPTNRREAERAVDLVFEHMRTRPVGETLGVVALSRNQADLIEHLIDERRILERDVDERFKERPDEPFFVKNLENVQGDERDHMIISIGYGPTVESGAVPNRFGPINLAGGERRLNVVITRARQRVDLVHSVRASDIHSQQEGARLLRRYLEYVSNPHQAFESHVTVDPAAESESPFELAVEQALIAKGYRVARQVGVAGYRIDLAILSEDGAQYDMGIECDGWAYHNAPAARDRDWLRQKVLEGLGWTIQRVWSTAWVRNAGAELARIEAALATARARTTFVEDTVRHDTEEPSPDPENPDPPQVKIAPTAAPRIHMAENEKTNLSSAPRWAKLPNETTSFLMSLITRVAEVEGPVHRDVVIDRIRECYGVGRVRGSTRDHVEHAIRLALSSGAVRGDGTFIWLREDQLSRETRRSVDGNIEHIPPSELKAITLSVARTLFGVPRGNLIVEVARILGYTRTGGRISEIVETTIQELLTHGQLVESFGMVHAAES